MPPQKITFSFLLKNDLTGENRRMIIEEDDFLLIVLKIHPTLFTPMVLFTFVALKR